MIRIENSILINANLQEVFEVAIDFEKYLNLYQPIKKSISWTVRIIK